jgi:uncharacterized LabA/DUF88 family protein
MNNISNYNIGIYFDLRYFSIIYNYYLTQKIKFNIEKFFDFVQYEVSSHLNVPMDRCEINKNEVHFYIGGTAYTEGDKILEDALVRARVGNNIHRLPLVSVNGVKKEKGVDTRLMLDAYKSAIADKYYVLSIITGDADFIPLVEDIKNDLNKPVFLFFWDVESTGTRTSQDLINIVTKPFAMHEILQSRVNKNPFANELLVKPPAPRAAVPENADNAAFPAGDLRTLLLETANECEHGEDGWILHADFGVILRKIKKYDPKKDGKKLTELFADYPDLFEIRHEPPLAVRLRNHVHPGTVSSPPVQGQGTVFDSVPRQLTLQEKALDYESFILMIDPDGDYGFINSPLKYSNIKINNYAFTPSTVQNPGNIALGRGVKVKFNLAEDSFRSLKFNVPLYRAVNVVVLE